MSSIIAFTQNYNHPKNGNATYNLPAANGFYHYYDDGGPNGSYSDGINNTTITFKVPDGHDLFYRVVYLDMHNDGCDYDYLITSFIFEECNFNQGNSKICEIIKSDGSNYPICGNQVSFTFKSNGSVNDGGWDIQLSVYKRQPGNPASGTSCPNGIVEQYECINYPSLNSINCDGGLGFAGTKIENTFTETFDCFPNINACYFNQGHIDYYPPFSGLYPDKEIVFNYSGDDEPYLCIETDCSLIITDIFMLHGCQVLQKGIKTITPNGVKFCFTNVPKSTITKTTSFVAEQNCDNGGDLIFCNFNVSCDGGAWDCPGIPDIGCCNIIYGNSAEGINVSTAYGNCYNPMNQQPNWSGPEQLYRFVATESGPVTVLLSDLYADLDMFILDNCDPNSACGPTSKPRVSHNPGSQDESITFDAVKGEDYYIVIDGWDGVTSTYTLEILCTPILCNPCGDCFLYTLKQGANSTEVKCFNKYQDCGAYVGQNVPSSPTVFDYKWFVDGVQSSNVENPIFNFPNGSTHTICQKIYSSNTLIFECCWTVIIDGFCKKAPTAKFSVSNLNNNTIEFDPGQSKDGNEYIWDFGDNSPEVTKDTSSKISHTFPSASTYTVCLYVKNANGISCYCMQIKTGNVNFLCQQKQIIPLFTTITDNNKITINTNQFQDIFEFSIDYGDGTSQTGTIWDNKDKKLEHTYPTGKASYNICITYKIKYFDALGKCCIYIGCYCFTIKIGCCTSFIDDCTQIIPYYIDDNQGLTYKLEYPTAGIQIIGWEIDDVPVQNSGSNSINFKFPFAGKYKVCCYYYDGAGCLIRCCKWIYVSNPFLCNSIIYSFNESNGYQFEIANPDNNYSDISWTVDAPVSQSLGKGNKSGFLPIPANCQNYVISVRFYDKTCGCYRICCIYLYICNPFNCGEIKYYLNQDGNYVFAIDGNLTDATWTFDDTNTFIGFGQNVTYTGPLNCAERIISVRYFDVICKCWRICCYRIYLCPPANCGNNIIYTNLGGGYVTLNSSVPNAQDISWYTLNNNTLLGNGNNLTVKLQHGLKITICMYYYNPVTKCYQVCCRDVDVSPLAASEQQDDTAFSVIPNPAKGGFRIYASGREGNAAMQIFDMTGKLVFSRDEYKINSTVEFQAPPGVYNIVLREEGKLHHLKLIKAE
ncbi:MAG: PKD domain-containing protein [Saprospiraceae bacterium]|nr:PKD domain-containing protein [Saprospiraceae bacterium]